MTTTIEQVSKQESESMSQRDTCETQLFSIQTAFSRQLLHAKYNHDDEAATATAAAAARNDVN